MIINASNIVGAKELERVLVAPQGTVTSGQPLIFTVYYNNLTDQQIQSALIFDPISCQLASGDKTVEITAHPVGTETDTSTGIPGNGFKKVQYQFTLPPQVDGNIKIMLLNADANTAAFFADKASQEAYAGEQLSLNDTSIFQPYTDNFSAYKPMYFLLGVDPGIEKSSFQLSFKYRFFNEEGFLSEKAPWLSGFNLGYTQKSLWDLDSTSAPFEDTSYMPELFYLADKIDLGVSWISAFGIQTGYQHESNGREGAESRSTNFAYIQPIMGFHLGGDYHLKIAPKVWAYVNNDDDTNPDLEKYRGYYDLEAKIGNPDSIALAGNFRNGDKGSTYQLDLSYPLSQLFGGSLDMYIHAQYFNGYAETLLDYNNKSDAFRLGISIVR